MVSDAGMPSICDPGEELVYQSKLHQIDSICIPAFAQLYALVSSGFPSSRFISRVFYQKKTERENYLRNWRTWTNNSSFWISHRLIKLLKEFKECIGGDREIEISRELTKKFEEHIHKDINAALDLFEGKEVIGEITVVIKGIDKRNRSTEVNKFLLKRELNDLINSGISLSSASKYLAKKYSFKKSEIYNLH